MNVKNHDDGGKDGGTSAITQFPARTRLETRGLHSARLPCHDGERTTLVFRTLVANPLISIVPLSTAVKRSAMNATMSVD
jgi:hypothetical protein